MVAVANGAAGIDTTGAVTGGQLAGGGDATGPESQIKRCSPEGSILGMRYFAQPPKTSAASALANMPCGSLEVS